MRQENQNPHNAGMGRRTLIKGALAMGAASLAGGAALATGTLGSSEKKPGDPAFAGKTAFITGGARGIGYATAEAFAQSGTNVVIFDICENIQGIGYPLATQKDLETAKRNIEKLGVTCLAIKGDVRDKQALQAAMAQTVEQLGTLDFLVVNAGVTQLGQIDELPDDESRAVLDINIAGALKTTQAAVPILRRQQSGRIVYLSSVLGRRGNKDWPVYCASKWAVIGLAKSTAHLMAQHNVMCNVVCPTLVHTKLIDNDYILGKWLPESPTYPALDAVLKNINPIPIGSYQPRDIAAIIKMFCGPETAQITGEVFDIGAGMNAESNA